MPLCLNSITSQTLLNIEIICIDDGSTDKSLDILREYKNKDKRIIIIQQKNLGSGIARNNGLKFSKGKYIAFMDSDDLYPDKYTLEIIFKNAIQNKVLICGGGLSTFVQYNNTIKLIKNPKISFNKNKIIYFSSYQYDFFYQRFIYNKNFIKKNKLYFPNYLRYQDPPFFIKSMGLAKKFFALKKVTYYYRTFHKKLVFTERKITDIYKGIGDCLHISKSMNLYKLYYLVLSRLNTKMVINQAKKFIKSKNLKVIISKIINNIDYDLLKKANFSLIINEFYIQLK